MTQILATNPILRSYFSDISHGYFQKRIINLENLINHFDGFMQRPFSHTFINVNSETLNKVTTTKHAKNKQKWISRQKYLLFMHQKLYNHITFNL